ncbi:Cenpo [Columba guinea]|nr:Cenpo [Columba guinea]
MLPYGVRTACWGVRPEVGRQRRRHFVVRQNVFPEAGEARSSSGGCCGVFAHLEMLEARAHEAAVKQAAAEQQKEQLARLEARVQELRQRRDELQAKVELQEQGQHGQEGVVSDPAQHSAQTVLEWKIRKVKSTLQVFYLTVRIHRHSIPTFIPMEQIAKKYLQTDIRRFLSVLSDHLNAYVGRRYQADQLQEHFSDRLEGTMQRNSLCNLLVFNYNPSSKSETFPFNARLLYGDLCCSLPTEVVISCAPDAPAALAETAAAHSDLFRRLALHKAFGSFGSAGEHMDGAQ